MKTQSGFYKNRITGEYTYDTFGDGFTATAVKSAEVIKRNWKITMFQNGAAFSEAWVETLAMGQAYAALEFRAKMEA